MRLGPDISRFRHVLLLEKIFSCHARNRMLFRQSQSFFSACFFDIISSMSPQILAKYF